MNKRFVPSFQSQMFAAFLIICVLDGLYITDQLITYLIPLRYALFSVFGIGLINYFWSLYKSKKIRKNQFYTIFFHLILLFYGLLLGLVNGGYFLAGIRDYLFAFIAVFFTLFVILEVNRNSLYLFSLTTNSWPISSMLNKIDFNYFFVLLLILSPILLYLLDVIQLSPIPNINFDIGAGEIYQQSTSGLFAVGSILLFYFALIAQNRLSLTIYLLFSLITIILSALGGARGEFIIGLIVLSLIILRNINKKRMLLIAICLSLIVGLILINYWDIITDLLIFERIAVIGLGNYGSRDILLLQSLDLFSDRIDCVLIGCGLNYFQIHFGYEYGMYPHNVFAELLITYGIPLGGLIIFLVCAGSAFGFLSIYSRSPLFWILLFFLGVSLKSGSLLGLTTLPTIIFFTYLGVLALSRFISYFKNKSETSGSYTV